MVPGEECAFRLKMPNGEPSEEAAFRVRLEALYNRILPELDDDPARAAGPYPNLEALREDIRGHVLWMKERAAREDYARAVIQRLVDPAEVECPSILQEERLQDLVEQPEKQLRDEQRMSLRGYRRG
jgi:FKBP-type peptidyl-prolyl cis-trans isomerase (trigger factor)